MNMKEIQQAMKQDKINMKIAFDFDETIIKNPYLFKILIKSLIKKQT